MKIAVIRQKYVNYGGAEHFVSDYASHMADAGHEVHIFANQWTPTADPNIHRHKVSSLKLNAFTRCLSFAWFAARAVKGFDIVQSHERTFHQDIYRAGDGCHKEWLEQRKKYLSPLKRFFLEWNLFHQLILRLERGLFEGGCLKIIAISEMVKKDILRHYRASEENIAVVYNGVSLTKFHPDNRERYRKSIRDSLGIEEGTVMVLFVGSGFERKGLRFLIRSLKHWREKNWKLVLMGRGDYKSYTAEACAEDRQKIICLDPVDDIQKYYAAADIFVLPSIYEPFGNANLEALASGLSCVVSGRSGASEIVTHKDNAMRLTNPDDPEEIADHINHLFALPVREAMGGRARELAENFTPERNVREMENIYLQVQAMKQGVSL